MLPMVSNYLVEVTDSEQTNMYKFNSAELSFGKKHTTVSYCEMPYV